MKIRVSEDGNICLEEIYNPVELVSENEVIVISQHDGRFEILRFEKHQFAECAPEVEELAGMLAEWLYEGRFQTVNCEEDFDLCKRTYSLLNKVGSEHSERKLW